MTRTREENAADMSEEEARTMTQITTIAGWLGELIEAHIAKCDNAFPLSDDCPAHVISEVHETRANIMSIGTVDMEAEQLIELQLDDGSTFNIRVEEV